MVKENSVEDIAFAGTVLPDDCGDADVLILVGLHEPFDRFLVDDDLYFKQTSTLVGVEGY